MRCLCPIPVRSKTGKLSYVPCGRCYACLTNERSNWIFRLKQEFKDCKSAYFITLTYDDEHLPFTDFFDDSSEPTLRKSDVKRFLHDFRNTLDYPVRYFLVGEYGENFERPHYHLALFDFQGDNIKLSEHIEKYWPYGGHHILYLSGALIGYITKYMLKKFDFDESSHSDDFEKPFRLMSKGLGRNWVNYRNAKYLFENGYPVIVNDGDYPRKIPRYFLDKIAENYSYNFLENERFCPSWASKSFRKHFSNKAKAHGERRMVSDYQNYGENYDLTELQRQQASERRAIKSDEQKRINKLFKQ